MDGSWASSEITSAQEGQPTGDSAYIRASLRYFLEDMTGPRVYLRAIAGIDTLLDNINVTDGDWTMYFQTAEGKAGWTKFKVNVRQGSDNFIVSHATTMTNSPACESEGFQLELQASPTSTSDLVRGIIDHCTMLWGTDSNFDIRNQNPAEYKVDSIFAYRNMFAQPISWNGAGFGCDDHGYNVGIGLSYVMGDAIDETKRVRNVVFFQNLLAHAQSRNPLANADLTWVNNIVYNPKSRSTYLRNEGPPNEPTPPYTYQDPHSSDFVLIENLYKKGPATGGGVYPILFGTSSSDTLGASSLVYIAGHGDDFTQTEVWNDNSNIDHLTGNTLNGVGTMGLPIVGRDNLLTTLLPTIGSTALYRTTAEQKILDDALSGGGTASSDGTGIINQVDVAGGTSHPGGFPNINKTKAVWTFPSNPNGASTKYPGFTRIEEWIHDNFTVIVEKREDQTIITGN